MQPLPPKPLVNYCYITGTSPCVGVLLPGKIIILENRHSSRTGATLKEKTTCVRSPLGPGHFAQEKIPKNGNLSATLTSAQEKSKK